MDSRAAKRVYEEAAVVVARGGFGVALDGRAVRTPAGALLAVPKRRLAEAIAAEFSAQEDEVRPHSMPIMRLAATAIDRVAPDRQALVESLLGYAATDLLCYRSEAEGELAERQHAAWQPLLDWAEGAYGARLAVTTGVVPIDQPEAALSALRRAVASVDDLGLAALSSAAAACGSLILALALAAGRIDADAAQRASHLDETYQSERWGEDREAADRRRRLHADIAAAATVLASIRRQED